MTLPTNCMIAYTATIPFEGERLHSALIITTTKQSITMRISYLQRQGKMVEMLYDFSFDFNKIINNRLT